MQSACEGDCWVMNRGYWCWPRGLLGRWWSFGWFRGLLDGRRGRLRAAVIAAVALEVCWGAGGERRLSAGGGWERFEPLERCLEFCDPRPRVLEVQLRPAAGERESGSDVQQPVSQPLGLGLGELAVEGERLGPDDQVVRERDDLEP
jgi:hypothetical protein